jgi:hypothetical protein
MTSDSRAVSTTSRLMTLSPLISSTRVIWVKSRWTSRKFPLVMRWTAAMASASVKSSADSVRPSAAQWRCRTKASSPADSGRYSLAGLAVRGDVIDLADEHPDRLVQLGQAEPGLPGPVPGAAGGVAGQARQAHLVDGAEDPLHLPPATGLTGQSWLILWITDRWMTGLLSGFAAGAFESADGLFVVTDLGGDGFETAAQLVDLDGQAGQGAGILAAGAVFLDDGAQVVPPVKRGPADAGSAGYFGERDRLPGGGQLGAGGLDPG